MSIGSISSNQNSYAPPVRTKADAPINDNNNIDAESNDSAKKLPPAVIPFWADNSSTAIPQEETLDVTSTNSKADYINALAEAAAKDLGQSSITFNDLLIHRDQLTKEFSAKMKEGLKKAGVAENADFRIVLNEEGGIDVKSNHPDKAKIEKFFKENPSLAKDYQHIEALNQLEQTRKSQNYDLQSAYSPGKFTAMAATMIKQAPTTMAVSGGGSLASILQGGGINASA